jgi:hypothetical protein
LKKLKPSEIEHLFCRRQFVISPDPVPVISTWRQNKIDNSLCLQTHPDLPVTQIQKNGNEITLIGYLIDPDNPDYGDLDILNNLLINVKDPHDILKQTDRLSGRWILIAGNGQKTILFTDPCGLRQVYYTDPGVNQTWCASQPGLISAPLGLTVDSEATSLFINSRYFKNDIEHWWPGDSSPFKDIKHLQPNHYLDLKNRTCKRFWPAGNLNTLNIEQATTEGANLIKDLMKAVAKRYQLVITLTAGWDSRLMLAATREIRKDQYYSTFIYRDLNENSPDIFIPSRLLHRLRLKHHLIDGLNPVPEIQDIYNQSIFMAHDDWRAMHTGLYRNYPGNRIVAKGACSEIARCFYHKGPEPEELNGSILAGLAGMEGNEYAIKYFSSWLDDVQACKQYGYNVLDYFYWENRAGNWLPTSLLAGDIVHEFFAPYNCRALITTLLAADIQFRKPPQFSLYTGMIKYLWSDCLSEPINPVAPVSIDKRPRILKLLRRYP